MFIAFRHRNYRLFFLGQMISLIGTWMQTAALAWLVLELTHSAFLLALVGVLQYLPVMVFSLFGAPISLLIGGMLSLVAAIAGWIRRKPAEKSLTASTTAMKIE